MPAEGLEPPTNGLQTRIRGFRGLCINHLQRLPAPSPGPPRHNDGTPNLGSAQSRHRDVRIGHSLISPPAFSC